MKKNVTRSALFTSIIALLLCVAMLVGTTFAWFTDEVVSAQNTIQAGNLDVELYYSDDMATWTPVETTTNIFEDGKWEPGHTEVVYLQVKNAGSLNLKYQLGVGIVSETGSKTADGVEFKLSQFIEYGIDDTVSAKYADRKAAVAALQSATKLATPFSSDVITLAPGATKEVALVVYMPETVDNDANHGKGEAVPTINLGLNVYATQVEAEDDSFGIDYDKGAYLPTVYTAAELASALEQGESVKLGADIATQEALTLADDTVLDLGGYKLSVASLTTDGDAKITNGTLEMPEEGRVTANGQNSVALEDVKIVSDGVSAYAVDGGTLALKNVTFVNTATSNPVQNYGGNLTMDNVTVAQAGDANTPWYSSALQVINRIVYVESAGRYQVVAQANTTVNSGTYKGVRALMISAPGGNVTINGGTFEGSEYAINADFYPNNYIDGDKFESVVTINGGTFIGALKVAPLTKMVIKGGTFTVDPSAYVPDGYEAVANTDGTFTVQVAIDTPAEFSDAISNAADGDVIPVASGNYTIPSSIAGKEITISGAGDSTVFNNETAANVNGASITFENVKFQGKNANVMNGFGIQGTTGHIAYVNCTFDGAVTNEYFGSVSYENCTFTGTGYITTYAVTSATFTNCVFDKDDSRAVLVYSHGDNPCVVELTDCKFYADAKGYTWVPEWTAAVEVDTTNIPTAGTSVTINNCTYDANYSGIVRDKSAAGKANAVITVDGVAF